MLLGATLGGCLVDLDGDGVVEMMFAGDSNTHWLSCAYPLVWQARHDPALVRAEDEGIFATTAHYWVDHDVLGTALLRDHPDAVLIALGTNDVEQGIPPLVIMANLATLYLEVAGFTLPTGRHPIPIVATVPPIYDPMGVDPVGTAIKNASIRQLNWMIRGWLPPNRVVDFDSWMPAEWDSAFMLSTWGPDPVHLSCDAHEIRADLVDDLLVRVR